MSSNSVTTDSRLLIILLNQVKKKRDKREIRSLPSVASVVGSLSVLPDMGSEGDVSPSVLNINGVNWIITRLLRNKRMRDFKEENVLVVM